MDNTLKGRTTPDQSRTRSGPAPNPDRTGPHYKSGPGGPVVRPIPDTAWARATIRAMKTGAIVTLAARGNAHPPWKRPALGDVRAIHEAEARAADLLNAAANAAVACLAAGIPNDTTLDILRLVTELTGALAASTPPVSNNCAEAI